MTYGTKKAIHDVRTIAEVEGGVVKPGKEVEWNEKIIVPPLPQTSLPGCELIKVEYYVKVGAPLLTFILASDLSTLMLVDVCSCGGQEQPSASVQGGPTSSLLKRFLP